MSGDTNVTRDTWMPGASQTAAADGRRPAYLALLDSGELDRRVATAWAHLEDCDLCARYCRVNRRQTTTGAVGRTGERAVVNSYGPHHGEEDPLRGGQGSGTIFFAWCSLRCVFCLNWEISQKGIEREVRNYWEFNQAAVREMHRQVGDLQLDERGLGRCGLLVRRLVLPGDLANTERVLAFLAAEISRDTYLNLMDQYVPCSRAWDYPPLDRPITHDEYARAVALADTYGLHRRDRAASGVGTPGCEQGDRP
jgi:uncharacterized Fe-S radical SAM superfamily protein PflX